MNAALEIVSAFRQACHQRGAALKDSSSGHSYTRGCAVEAGSALGCRRLAVVEAADEPAAKLLYLGEGVRLSALIDHGKDGPFFHVERVGLKVPLLVGSTLGRFSEQVLKCGRGSNGYVFAEVRADRCRGVERCRIALIKRHHLRDSGGCVGLYRCREYQTRND